MHRDVEAVEAENFCGSGSKKRLKGTASTLAIRIERQKLECECNFLRNIR